MNLLLLSAYVSIDQLFKVAYNLPEYGRCVKFTDGEVALATGTMIIGIGILG